MVTKAEERINLTLTVEEIYKVLCPDCRDRLLSLAARSVAVDSVKKQLKEQFEGKK